MSEYIDLEKKEGVYHLTMTDTESGNGLKDSFVREFLEALDVVEQDPSDTALVIRSSDPKNWCVGVDLAWLETQPEGYLNTFIGTLESLVLRLALVKVPTVACINGHCFGGGALLAAACDFRYMRVDRGFFCFPEIDVKVALTDALQAVIDCLPNKKVVCEMVLLGTRLSGEQAEACDIVDGSYAKEDLLNKALARADELKVKDRVTYTNIKLALKRDLVNF